MVCLSLGKGGPIFSSFAWRFRSHAGDFAAGSLAHPVAPLLNPDAARADFTTPRCERTSNGNPLDDDLDMQVDEDGPDDLNQDGLITSMRVKDPEGE